MMRAIISVVLTINCISILPKNIAIWNGLARTTCTAGIVRMSVTSNNNHNKNRVEVILVVARVKTKINRTM